MTIIPQKRCTECGVDKPLTEFHKHPTGKYGLHPRCKQCRREYMRSYTQTPEVKQRNKGRRATNSEKSREYSRNWKKNHSKRNLEIQMEWRKTPNGKRYNLHHNARRRAQTKSGDVTTAQLNELFERQTHCAYCKRKFTTKLPPTVDHVIPVSRGGLHTISNLVLACKSCNCSKRDNVMYLL